MNYRFSNWLWGTFLLLAATFVVANQFGGFVELGLGSVIVAALAVAFFVQCLAQLSFAPLPIPLAVLYITFQNALDWPYMKPWTLLLAAALASAGLSILFPRKWKRPGVSRGERRKHRAHARTGDGGNNPSVSVNFGAASRYLHADCLETVRLDCHFGAMEVFFDQARLSPNGAEASLSCSFGAIEIIVPRHWRIIDRLSCSLGGADVGSPPAPPAEDAPRLTLTGNVSLGGVEVRYV